MIGRKSLRTLLLFVCAVVMLVNLCIYITANSKIDSSFKFVLNDRGKVDWHDYKLILAEKSQVGPGEKGTPFFLTDPVEIARNDEAILEEGFAVLVSEKISLNRSMADARPADCKVKKYLKDLPKTSVVITFYNEHWTLLLRCLHSIVNRSPPELLHEIILVNDKSTESANLELVKSYIATHFDGKVKMFENPERSGLIVSRIEGAKKATGEVILFLDSHMEVNINWLPPLLEPIQLNSKTATVPIVGGMDPRTLKYNSMYGTRGGFDWTLTFKWLPLRKQDQQQPAEPHEFIAMPGGAYAIRKDYFFELGAYDEGMKVWNGENYELSFKIWLCGGRLLQVPCSNVAHLSKSRVKYREENYGFDYSARNLKRVAEVWMDEYKEFVYKQDPKKYSIDAGDLTKQFELKKRLNCKPFKYFIEEIASDLLDRYPISERGDFAKGAIFSEMNSNLCVTIERAHEPLKLLKCNGDKKDPETRQNFALTWHRNIKQNTVDEQCVDLDKMTMYACHFGFGNQFWRYDPSTRQIINPNINHCFTADISDLKVISSPCDVADLRQRFNWGYVNFTACANWETFGVELP